MDVLDELDIDLSADMFDTETMSSGGTTLSLGGTSQSRHGMSSAFSEIGPLDVDLKDGPIGCVGCNRTEDQCLKRTTLTPIDDGVACTHQNCNFQGLWGSTNVEWPIHPETMAPLMEAAAKDAKCDIKSWLDADLYIDSAPKRAENIPPDWKKKAFGCFHKMQSCREHGVTKDFVLKLDSLTHRMTSWIKELKADNSNSMLCEALLLWYAMDPNGAPSICSDAASEQVSAQSGCIGARIFQTSTYLWQR